VVTGSGDAAVPYFIWNGSNWALASTPTTRMIDLSCNVSASAAASRTSTRTTGRQLRFPARSSSHGRKGH
jgi:hypothetical protein